MSDTDEDVVHEGNDLGQPVVNLCMRPGLNWCEAVNSGNFWRVLARAGATGRHGKEGFDQLESDMALDHHSGLAASSFHAPEHTNQD